MDIKNNLYLCTVLGKSLDCRHDGMFTVISDSLEGADVKVKAYFKAQGLEKAITECKFELVGTFESFQSSIITNKLSKNVSTLPMIIQVNQ